MDLIKDAGPLRVFRKHNGDEVEISTTDPEAFFKGDITRHRITGRIPPVPNLGLVNFVESILIQTYAERVDFSECDFKDTLLKEAHFESCTFREGAFATCFFQSCTFSGCTFYNVSVHNAHFARARFVDCNLTNLLIKSSRFVDCEFVDCVTSNKLMEMSTIDSTSLIRTDIQIQTITSNFGFTRRTLVDSSVRTGRARESHHAMGYDEIAGYLRDSSLSSIEKLRLEYFLDDDLTQGSFYLDEALILDRWLDIYNNPGSFVETLEGLSEFLVRLYERDGLLVHTVLKFHDITARLTQSIGRTGEFNPAAHRILLSLGGVHLALSRIVETYLATLALVDMDKSVSFLVEGPYDKDFYNAELSEWTQGGNLHISKLVVRNSPLELQLTGDTITIFTLVAAVLSMRTRIELLRIREELSKRRKAPAKESNKSDAAGTGQAVARRESPQRLFLLQTGFGEVRPDSYQLQVKSILPGSLLIDLRLGFDSRLAGRLRKILVDLLLEDGQEVKSGRR